jgi:hypothetical protein
MKTELDPRFELKDDPEFRKSFLIDSVLVLLCAAFMISAFLYMFCTIVNPRIW